MEEEKWKKKEEMEEKEADKEEAEKKKQKKNNEKRKRMREGEGEERGGIRGGGREGGGGNGGGGGGVKPQELKGGGGGGGGQICSDNFTCCHTKTEVADQTFYHTQSQFSDTRPTSPSADPITPGAWQGSHWGGNISISGITRPGKNPIASGIGGRLKHKAKEAMS